jgi:putative ABC transport system permease protein
MLRNYFKTAWRNLLRNKSYAALNIIGLTIGITSCLLIFLIVRFESSFDNYHLKKEHIYRVVSEFKNAGVVHPNSGVPFPTSEGLRADFNLKEVAAIFRISGHYYVVGDNRPGQPVKKFREEDAYYAEPQLFDVFDFGWLAGDKRTALTEPNSVVLSRDEANRFFGNWHDAIGKVIRFGNESDLKVTGILKNTPPNTDIPVKLIISYATIRSKTSIYYENMQDWVSTNSNHNCFIVLPDNVSAAQFDGSLKAFVRKHKPADYMKDGLRLQPLSDIHYNADIDTFSGHTFSKQLLRVISLIGLFLLIIACVNFINLATAQAVNRSKEVGVRKVLGSNRGQLIVQFISETFIITLSAVFLAILAAELVLPLLNSLLETELKRNFISDRVILLFLSGVVIGVTLLSGFYPALVLSGFNVIDTLKNKIKAERQTGISLRRTLVVVQFAIAQVLVIGTLVIISQMNYFTNKSLGFEKDAIVTVPFPNDSVSRTKLVNLHNQLLLLPGIKDISYSFASPSDNNGWGSDFKYNNAPKQTDFSAQLKWADAEYFKLYGLQFVAGQAYANSDTIRGYVVNETLLNKLGVRNPKEAIGKYIQLWDDKSMNAPIVGVVKDFNTRSLKRDIPPVLMSSWKDVYQKINIKLQPANINLTMKSVERLWNGAFPDGMYEYQFLDKKIADFYKNDDRLSQLYKIFAGIAIFISCLGLYGLVSFMAVQRNKEVGIRKTLGASVGSIVYLFSKEFTVLVVIAFAIAAPVGYYFMHQWLEDFSYKITIGPGIFLLSIFVSVAIAWITVGYKSLKAALVNPVTSLRSE